VTRRLVTIASAVAVLAAALPARAQLKEVEVDRGASRELYIRKRPPTPASPRLPKILDQLLKKKVKLRNAKRAEAIKLLKQFLAGNPTGDMRAEGLFKLAELLWEDARRVYIVRMDRYQRKLEACRRRGAKCRRPPKEPRLDLSASAKYYNTLLRDHPRFRRTDLVLYLVGFAAKEAGKNRESRGYFTRVIKRFPQSRLYGDAWMMIGEYYFAARKWTRARQAYSHILSRPKAATYDLALFKTAWCDWKLGDHKLAARRFKQVLDLAEQAKRSGNIRLRRRRAQLRDQALDYLVIVFTEDQTISAKEIYDFLASIGGERYSHDVLVRVADAYYINTDYERSVDTYRFLQKLKPTSIKNSNYQRRIIEAYVNSDEDKAVAAISELAAKYGPNSAWAKANGRYRGKLKRNLALNEALVSRTAKNMHSDAQAAEKRDKRPNLVLYRRAAAIYSTYLKYFPKDKRAPEIRFLRAEILRIKLHKYEEAGDEYLAVGRTAPVGKYHKEALLKAMAAFEKARPKNVTGRRELSPVDRKFAAAVDLYATLFPADPKLVGVIFRNGQMFYDYGDYDEAIKRFGLIVTKYPKHRNAGPAGDRILTALAKAEDYENIEEWARKLRKAKAFQSRSQQARLKRLIVQSIIKNGDKHNAAGKYTRAAGYYMRIPKEFPNHPEAPKATYNAAVMLEKAKRPAAAALTYLRVARKYGRSRYGAKSAFTAGQVYESMVYYDRAAEAYELVVKKYPRSKYGADALFDAGVLRQALGEYKTAGAHYRRYSRRYRRKKDASEVAFRIGVVFENAGDYGHAERAFRNYAARYRSSGAHVIEAYVRAGRTAHKLGHSRRAAREFRKAMRRYRRLRNKKAKQSAAPWAAEARYYQGEAIYKRYVAIKFDINPRRLTRTLKRKSKLLARAQKVYVDVVKFADPLWTTASLYRIGRIYEEFSKALTGAKVPPQLSDKQKQAYRDALNNHVVTIEQKAAQLYEKGYKKAMELQVYNKFTRKIREGLGRLMSSQYPPENEARAHVRLGDRPPTPHIIDEVVR